MSELQQTVSASMNGVADTTISGDKDLRGQQEAQERAVGITAFASAGSVGLQCVFKQRYTDFLVNEITLSGETLHLTEIAAPPSKKQKKEHDTERETSNGESVPGLKRGAEDAPGTVVKRQKIAGEQGTAEIQNEAGAQQETAEPQKETGAQQETAEPRKEAGAQQETAESQKEAGARQKTAEPDQEAEAQQEPAEPQQDAQAQRDPVAVDATISDEDKQSLEALFGAEITSEIMKLYTAVLTHPLRKPRDHITIKTEVIESKPVRTQAHGAVRIMFKSRLETATLTEEPGRMTIKAAPLKSTNDSNGRGQNPSKEKRGRVRWDELGGDYLHFTLYKENKDTMEALYFIASQLKVKMDSFSFAGTKDRRGVTVQRVAVYRVQKERLMHLTSLARGWKLGDFEYKQQGLDLGGLTGNEFVITLRDCHLPGTEALSAGERLKAIEMTVSKAATNLGNNGYINFYGLQRFGSYQTGTHIIGMKILQNDLEGAIDSILTYDSAVLPENLDQTAGLNIPSDDIDRAEAIRIWQQTQNASKARDRMPRRFQAESNIITYLGRKADGHKQDKDWQGALMCIQRSLRMMYVHAYQSYVWNTAAVRRREIYGPIVVAGDLVVVGEKDDAQDRTEDTIDQDGDVVIHPHASEDTRPAEDVFIRARPLSQDEAESGRWDIFDIVLPLPGWDVQYPMNDMGEFYKEFMSSEEGGHLDPHNMRRSWKVASLSGSYRKLMSRPLLGKVDVQAQLYAGEQQLVQTDVDRLVGRAAGTEASEQQLVETDVGQPDTEVSNDAAQDYAKVAVVLRLQLGSSQYATMALRELTKGGAVAYKPDFSASRGRPQ